MHFTSRQRKRRESWYESCRCRSRLSKRCCSGLRIKSLLSLVLLLKSTNALECSTTNDQVAIDVSTTVAAASCMTDGACFVKVSLSRFGHQVEQGCLSKADRLLVCDESTNSNSPGFTIHCCYEDHCNVMKKDKNRLQLRSSGENERDVRMVDANSTEETMTTTENDSMLRTAAILTAVISLIAVTTIIALVVTVSVCCCYRHGNYRHHQSRRRRHHEQGDEEIGQSDSRISFASSECCEAIIPSGETLSNLLQSAHHHSSSPSLLVQRSVARHTNLERTLVQGEFYKICEGRWRSDQVLVKIYPSKYERLWFTETEIYQTSHIPNPNILNFIAAEIIQKNSQTFHHIICEYHERGTLCDYLKTTSVDVHGLLVLGESVASGLAHLHSETHDNQGVLVKLAIAHGNLTSRSIYVKADGSCCIADLSMAVKDDCNLSSQLRGRPHLTDARYLAPEFLERYDVETLDFTALKKADMYSFALVLWEIARRCWIQGLVEEAVLPYSDIAPSEQTTVEQMKDIVCVQERRPPLADQWSLDESMSMVLRIMKECWHQKSEVRLTALRVKKTLHKLNDSVRPLLDKNGKVSMQYEFDREKFHS